MALHAGIEIDDSCVRIAVLDVSSKQTVLVDYIESVIDGETVAERVDSLTEILKTNLGEGDRVGVEVASALPTRLMTLRDFSVPFTKDEVIQKTIRYESEGHIPGVVIDDLIIDYIKCSEGETSSHLLIGAINKESIQDHLNLFKGSGLDPMQVEIDSTALATTFHVSHPELRTGRTLLVDMESGHTTFVLLEEGRITRLRSTSNHMKVMAKQSLPAPEPDTANSESDGEAENKDSSPLNEEFSQLFEEGEKPEFVEDPMEELAIAVVSDEEFDQLQVPGMKKVVQVEADPESMLDRLVTEIQRTFAGYWLRDPIDRIMVSGKVSKDLAVADRLSEEFQVTAQYLRVCDSIETSIGLDKVDRCNESGAIAVGLALGAAGQGLTNFDLRKEEFRYERRFANLIPGLIMLGFILCMSSIALLIDSHREGQLRKSEYETVRENQLEVYRARFGEDPVTRGKGGGSIFTAAEREIMALKGGSSGNNKARIDEYVPILELFEDVTKGVSAARPEIYPEWTNIDLSGLKRSDRKSIVSLRVLDATQANSAAGALAASTKFFRIEDDLKSDGEKKKLTLNLFLLQSVAGGKRR